MMLEIKTKTPIPLHNSPHVAKLVISEALGIPTDDIVANVDYEDAGYGFIKAGNSELTFTQNYSGITVKVNDIGGGQYTPLNGQTIPVSIIAALTVVDRATIPTG